MKEAILPSPPGTNNLFVNVNGRGRVKSTRYRDWIQSAGLILNAARLKPQGFPCAVCIRVGKPKRARDLDGYLKATIDLLVTCGVLPDDGPAYVGQIMIAWRFDEVEPACVGVAVRPMSPTFLAPHMEGLHA